MTHGQNHTTIVDARFRGPLLPPIHGVLLRNAWIQSHVWMLLLQGSEERNKRIKCCIESIY